MGCLISCPEETHKRHHQTTPLRPGNVCNTRPSCHSIVDETSSWMTTMSPICTLYRMVVQPCGRSKGEADILCAMVTCQCHALSYAAALCWWIPARAVPAFCGKEGVRLPISKWAGVKGKSSSASTGYCTNGRLLIAASTLQRSVSSGDMQLRPRALRRVSLVHLMSHSPPTASPRCSFDIKLPLDSASTTEVEDCGKTWHSGGR